MRSFPVIIFLALFIFPLIIPIKAKEVALVIGGTSNKDEESTHEFARGTIATAMGLKAQGAEVRTIFGYMGMDEPESMMDRMRAMRGHPPLPKEREQYKEDYDKLKAEFPETKAITKENILSALRSSLESMNSGDKFSLVLNAHGNVECNEAESNSGTIQKRFGKDMIRGDFDENCHHEISIATDGDSPTRFKTEEIIPILKEMEEKGIEVNAVFDSCHSGVLKRSMNELEKTCSSFLASGDAVGYGCFESDPEGSTDYTSTMEYIKYQAYAKIADQLRRDPYFQSKKCFEKVDSHARGLGLSGDETVAETYWRARQADLAPHEPSISDSLGLEYFRQGNYSKQFSYLLERHRVCQEEMMSDLSAVLNLVPESVGAVYYDSLREIERLLSEFNNSMDRQEEIVTETNNLSPTDLEGARGDQLRESLSQEQERTTEILAAVMRKERELTPVLRLATEAQRGGGNCDRVL